MAQRSARARSKLDKITQQNEERAAVQSGLHSLGSTHRCSTYSRSGLGGGSLGGGARLGSGGLLTPSASSVSGSSRNSIQGAPAPRIGKSGWKSLFDVHGGGWKRGLGGHKKGQEETFYAGLGRGLMDGLGSMSTIGEEKILVKRWEGGGGMSEAWDGFGKDKKDWELWFQDGDTLVYLAEKPVASRNTLSENGLYKPATPQPSLRIRSNMMKELNSPYLMMQLEESAPETSESSKNTLHENMDFVYELKRTKTIETASSASISTTHGEIKYHLYLPAPPRLDKEGRHRYHLTTRNFFAMLFGKSLVGKTLGQSLKDLVERTDIYLSSTVTPIAYDLADRGIGEIESPYGPYIGPVVDNPQAPSHPTTLRMILDYILHKEFDDVRNSPESSAGLLFFSEWVCQSYIDGKLQLHPHDLNRAEAIWKECFVHCTGQLSHLHGQQEWHDISAITKAFADRASLEIQVRASKADSRLAGFNFVDMWPVMNPSGSGGNSSQSSTTPARIAFDKFQKFLLKHYHARFGSWPPQEGRFTRTLYLHLQRDFTALYDYLVDRDAVWSPPYTDPSPHGRKITKRSHPFWRADDNTFFVSDLLSKFDIRENHPPIPHPYPLIPTLTTPPPLPQPQQKQKRSYHTTPQSFFTPITRSPSVSAAANPAAALALTESTNISALYTAKTLNPLVEAFSAHEKTVASSSSSTSEGTLADARIGRWMMIYGVLQTLASVAVDVDGLRWTDGVEYPLNPRLRGTPPWKAGGVGRDEEDERSHWRSYCWVSVRGVVEESGDEGDDEGESVCGKDRRTRIEALLSPVE